MTTKHSLALIAAIPFSVTFNPISYAQVSGKFVPSDDSTLFFVGQTTPDLSQYKSDLLSDSSFPAPTGVTLYTNIFPETCSGLDGPCDLNGNSNDFQATLQEYPGADVNVGLFLSDNFAGCNNQPLRALMGRDDEDIVDGLGAQYREEMDTLIRFLRDSGRRVFLRIGYEFDGPWNCYNTEFHKAAFRYVKGRIDALNADNVATVWQSASYPIDGSAELNFDFSNPNHWDTWYPGDDVVDWIGISTFFFDDSIGKFQTSCVPNVSSAPETIYDRVVAFAAARNKPILIAESTPVGYRTQQLDASCILQNAPQNLPGGAEELWNDWYAPFFEYISENSSVIRGVSYINSNWELIGQFNCAAGSNAGDPDCTDGYWGNSRIQDSVLIRNRFSEALSNLGAAPSGGDEPPADEPPADEPPADEPPADEPPADEPPADEPPADEPPAGGDGSAQCGGSHPFACGGQCFTDANQASSAGCSVEGNDTAPVGGNDAGNGSVQCPASHPFACGNQCFTDANQASFAGCSL